MIGEEFHKTFIDLGGKFFWEQYEKPEEDNFIRNLIKAFEVNIDTDWPPQSTLRPRPVVIADFIFNDNVNACARRVGEKYFAGIYSGTLLVLRHLFTRMMTSKKVLVEIGDPNLETGPAKIFNPQLTSANKYLLAWDPSQNLRPKDISRHYCADVLATLAIVFLLNHELGHIYFGHLGLLLKGKHEISYAEVGDNSKFEDVILVQTLEMDADFYATFKGISYIRWFNENINTLNGNTNPFLVGHEKAIKLLVFSIYSMFRIFGIEEAKESSLTKFQHPPSGVRQAMIFEAVWWSCQHEKIDLPFKKISSLLRGVVQEVELAFEEISVAHVSPDAINFAYSPPAVAHGKLLLKNWTAVRELLMPFAYAYPRPAYELS